MPRYRETRGLEDAWLKIEKKARQSQHKDRNPDYQGYNSHVFELKVIRHKESFHVQFKCRVERLLGKTPRRSNTWIDPSTRSDLRFGILAAEPIGLAASVVGGEHRGQPWPDAGPFHRLSPGSAQAGAILAQMAALGHARPTIGASAAVEELHGPLAGDRENRHGNWLLLLVAGDDDHASGRSMPGGRPRRDPLLPATDIPVRSPAEVGCPTPPGTGRSSRVSGEATKIRPRRRP